MEFTVPQLVMSIVGQLIVAAAIWGGIRADLKHMHERINNLSLAIDKAHSRLDAHLELLGQPNRRSQR